MRRTAALAVVAFCLVACGEPGGATSTFPMPNEGSPSSTSTSTPASSSSTTSTTVTEPGVTAPDFTLALGGGGTFVLSEEARPVYLVFWAEW